MVRTSSILVVDDDPRLCRLLSRYLTAEGYTVHTAGSARDMREMMALEEPRLVILDLMLPDEDGLSLARELRARSDIGILMLTGKRDPVDRIVGLELGADDYMTKPFDERELLARVRSILRRVTPSPSEHHDSGNGSVLTFDGWTLDLAAWELTDPAGRPVELTSHEFELLAALASHAGRVLSRDAILEIVAGRDWTPYDRSVDVLVGKLRRKLGDDPRAPRMIKTVRGAGYKLTPHVDTM
ncbi:response regulator [Lentisalinibacter orientalis]|uniref:response regulator n=1 Tax=Lentisalinibacter orientalis TaxID=2992241 RepID=UPI003868670A